MAEAQNTKIETLEKGQNNTIIKNGNESIDDSGIEMSGEEKEKVEANITLDCPWILGQLAWARGSSYPFWPCVVSQDPKTLLYYKVQNKGRSQALMVHVQYFGDGGRHNWVLSHYMIPFSGLDDFQKRAKSVSPEAKKKDPKFAAAFSPKLVVKKQWGIGVTEASGLMHLSNEERASMFEPATPPPAQITQSTNNKLKRKLSTKGSKISSETPTSGPKIFKKIENIDRTGNLVSRSEPTTVTVSKLETESVSCESTSVPDEDLNNLATTVTRRKSTRSQNKNFKEAADVHKRQYTRKKVTKLSEKEKKRRDEIDFEDYYNLNNDFWKADHPNATDEEVMKLLRDMWDEMDAEEKSNNLNRNFDEYRYNFSTDQTKVKHLKQTTLQPVMEISKDAEISQQEKDKNKSEIIGKNDEGSTNNNRENTISDTKNNSKDEKGDENSKAEDISQNRKRDNSEIKNSSQEDLEKENLKQNGSSNNTEQEKIFKSCLEIEKSALKAINNTTETKIAVAEEGEVNDNKMQETDQTDKDDSANGPKEKTESN